jgi:hypothetical protein
LDVRLLVLLGAAPPAATAAVGWQRWQATTSVGPLLQAAESPRHAAAASPLPLPLQ